MTFKSIPEKIKQKGNLKNLVQDVNACCLKLSFVLKAKTNVPIAKQVSTMQGEIGRHQILTLRSAQ